MARLLSVLLTVALCGAAYAQGAPPVRQGDYTAAVTDRGLVVEYKGTRVTCGSRLTLFKPGWSGTYYSERAFAATKTAKVTATGTRLVVTDTLPDIGGRLSYTADVDTEGVTVSLAVSVEKPIEGCPVEYAAAQFDPERFAGGEYLPTSVLGEGERVRLAAEKPKETGPGTTLIRGDVTGIALRGKGLEVQADAVDGRPGFYDMRSRDYPEGDRVYWLLYQPTLSRGELKITTRLSARSYVEKPAIEAKREVTLMEGRKRTRLEAICLDSSAHAIERAAAHELQGYLKRMGAGPLEIIEVGQTPVPREGVLYVGRSDPASKAKLLSPRDLEGLGPDGYVVRARGGNVVAAGGGYRGTVYAVYKLLEHLGCRFYGNEMEVVPEEGALEIKTPLHLKSAPAFEWRAMWGTVAPMKAGLSPGEWPADVADVALPKMMGSPKGGFWHHTMGFLLPAKDLPKEYLAMVGGERKVREPAVQQYCLSNPELLRRMTEVSLRWMDEDPNPVYYPIHYGDVGSFCECQACKALYAEKGSVTDAVIWFLNQIAAKAKEKHPEKFLTILSYWGTRTPPVKERPADNLLIIYCAIRECQARPWSHPINLKYDVCKDLERWIAIHPLGAKGIITFEYPCTYYYAGYPYPALYAHAENLRYYKRLGLRGVYICGLTRGHLLNLYSYVMPRLFWDPDQDLGKLIDEFAKAWYGPAWKPMRDYVDVLHRAAMASTSQGVMDCHAGPGQRYCRELYTRDLLDKCERLFADAEAAAKSEVVKRRIWNDKWGLLFVDLFLNAGTGRDLVPDETPAGFHTALPDPAQYARIAEFLKISRALGRSWDIEPRRHYSMSAVTGFEPTTSPWSACPKVRRVMDDPQAAYRQEVQESEAALGKQVVVLENAHTQVQLLPSLGGRIWRLRAKATGEDLLRRNPVPRHLLASGLGSDSYADFGGYEEYVGEMFGSPGWAEKYDCTLAADKASATLTTRLPGGLEVRRIVRLLPDRPGVEVDTQVTNATAAVVRGVLLRAHPEFRFGAGKAELSLATRRADGGWASQRPAEGETWLAELPAGAWGITAGKARLTNEFDAAQVSRCLLYAAPKGEFHNLELFSPKKDLAPGESLRLAHRYVVEEVTK